MPLGREHNPIRATQHAQELSSVLSWENVAALYNLRADKPLSPTRVRQIGTAALRKIRKHFQGMEAQW